MKIFYRPYPLFILKSQILSDYKDKSLAERIFLVYYFWPDVDRDSLYVRTIVFCIVGGVRG